MKDEFNAVLNEIEMKYDDGKWWHGWRYRYRPQHSIRNTRRAVHFTTDEANLVSQQYLRKCHMLDSLSSVRWGYGRFAALMQEEFQQHKYHYMTWMWLRSFDHEASVQYYLRVVKPYHDQNRDLIYMFGRYLF